MKVLKDSQKQHVKQNGTVHLGPFGLDSFRLGLSVYPPVFCSVSFAEALQFKLSCAAVQLLSMEAEIRESLRNPHFFCFSGSNDGANKILRVFVF